MQFSSDDVARTVASVLHRVLAELNIQHTVEGIAVLPAGDSTFLVDVAMCESSTRKMWGVSITIPPAEEK